jgi:DNA polymerase I-like protein with 3'-5' exonuclease and polymerase domains
MSLSLAYGRVVAPEEVTHAQRYVHKRAVFLESYGGAWLKLQTKLAAEGVVLGVAEVKQLLRTLAEARPTLMRWRERVLEAAERDRCLRNPFGRLRWFLGPAFGDALNFIPQSTAADIILDAMVLVYERLPKGAIMVAQVHDELIVEHPPALVKEVRAVMQESMEAPVAVMDGWQFPVEGKSGRDWTFAEG